MVTPLPTEFVDRLSAIFGDDTPAILATFAHDRRVGVWANPLRGADDPLPLLEAIGVTGEQCAWLPGAATIAPADRDAVTASDAASDGRLYVQNLSSMLAPRALNPLPGETVLDLAAAPGGKTLHLAARMRLAGELAAVEPVRSRFHKLRENLARCGAGDFVRTFPHDGREIGRKTPGRFDAVLLDAPCTGEARFDLRRPETFAYWGPRKIAESARKQKALVRSAFEALRPGGRLLYATCAFSPEENELVIAHTLRRLGDAVAVEPITLPIAGARPGLNEWSGKPIADAVSGTARVTPDSHHAGFYLALLRKNP